MQYVADEQSPKSKPMYTVDAHMDEAVTTALKNDPKLRMTADAIDLNKSMSPFLSMSGKTRKRGASVLSEVPMSLKKMSSASGLRLSAVCCCLMVL